jgi:tetratricopeptide (TPR) repeat protein
MMPSLVRQSIGWREKSLKRFLLPTSIDVCSLKIRRFGENTALHSGSNVQFPAGLKMRAQRLLVVKPGGFTKSEYVTSRDIMDRILRSKVADHEALSLGFSLILRLAKELNVVVRRDESVLEWFCHLRLNSLFEKWREAVVSGQDVISPRALVQVFNDVVQHVPQFQFNKHAYAYATDAVIRQASSHDAPILAEELLGFIRKEAGSNSELRPNSFTYSRILQAWSASNRNEASTRMEEIIQSMLCEGIPPDSACYNVLLRYHARMGDAQQVDLILQTIEKRGLQLSIFNLSQAIYVHSNSGQLEKAENFLHRLMKLQPRDEFDKRNVGESIQNLMSSYRKLQKSPEFSVRENALYRAEEMFRAQAKDKKNIDAEDFKRLVGTMADIYVRAGRQSEAEAILAEHGRADTVSYNILMKGKCLDDATKIFDMMLRNHDVSPSLHSFNSLLSLWAHSTKSDKVQQAFRIYGILKDHPRCRELGIHPDEYTYTILLKCLSRSYDKDCGQRALKIVQEMIHRSQNGNKSCEPDRSIFSCAILTCIQSKDNSALETLLELMENSTRCLPNVRDYNHLMNIYAKLRLPEPCERVLSKMKRLSDSNRTELRPNVVSYSLLINAWARSNYDQTADKIWSLFEEMKRDKVALDTICYTRILQVLSGSQRRQMITRAEYLLDCMEKDPDIQVDHRHYTYLMRGWLDMQDIELASQICMRCVKAHILKNDPNVRLYPDAASFHALMVAWIRIGNIIRATEFVLEIQRLFDENMIPIGLDIQSVKYLLHAWKFYKHPGRSEAISKLLTIIKNARGKDTSSPLEEEQDEGEKVPFHA